MSEYFEINCPECGNIFDAGSVAFSLADVVRKIAGDNMELLNSSGFQAIGHIDESKARSLIIDNDWLWDLKISYLANHDKAIELRGQEILDFLVKNNSSEEMVGSLYLSEDTNVLVEKILQLIPAEKKIRGHKRNPNLDERSAIRDVVEYAKSGGLLFKGTLKYVNDKDTNGRLVIRSLECANKRIESKRCPNCGHRFSKWAGLYEEKVISVIGTPYVGKTAYFTSIISALNTGGFEYGVNLEFDTDTIDYKQFQDNLVNYKRGFAIQKTAANETPQITVKLKNIENNREFLYTLVDIPGELFTSAVGDSKDDILDNRKIIKNSDAVWFCMSADQAFNNLYDSERDLDANKITRKSSIENVVTKELDDIAINIDAFVNQLFKNDEERPPIALVITKCDQLSFTVYDDFKDDTAGYEDCSKLICYPVFEDMNGNITMRNTKDAGEPVQNGTVINKDDRVYYALDRFSTRNQGLIHKFISQRKSNGMNTIMGKLCSAFSYNGLKIQRLPIFFVASYGRKAAAFNLNSTILNLLEKYPGFKEKFARNRFLSDVFDAKFNIDDLGEYIYDYEVGADMPDDIKEKLAALLSRCEKNEDIKSLIFEEYKKYNPLYTFGLFNPMFWVMAYTGFLDCVTASGSGWTPLSDPSDIVKIRRKLMLQAEKTETEQEPEPSHVSFFGKMKRFIAGN